MLSHAMILFVLVFNVASGQAPSGGTSNSKLQNLERQVQILSNLVNAQSKILATVSSQTCQTDDVARLQGEVKILDIKRKTYEAHIQQLQSSMKDLSNKLKSQETKLTSVDTKYASEASKLRSEIKNVVQKSNNLGNTVTNLKNRVNQLTASWPSGKYCILASGSCPPGFSRSSAYMKAISLYAGNGNYIRPGTFGDSKIKCHGRCGQYGHWTGELYLVACCK